MNNEITLLYKILSEKKCRKKMIKNFQDSIWSWPVEKIVNEEVEILRALAYDLDFFEPEPSIRKEDPSYYDEKKLIKVIKKALSDLNGFSN